MKTQGVLETALYCDDLEKAVSFYRKLFAFSVLFEDERLCRPERRQPHRPAALSQGGIVAAQRHAGRDHPAARWAGAAAPGVCHHGRGPARLGGSAACRRGRHREPGVLACGGHSVYFRDPDGHLLELVTPGLWAIY